MIKLTTISDDKFDKIDIYLSEEDYKKYAFVTIDDEKYYYNDPKINEIINRNNTLANSDYQKKVSKAKEKIKDLKTGLIMSTALALQGIIVASSLTLNSYFSVKNNNFKINKEFSRNYSSIALDEDDIFISQLNNEIDKNTSIKDQEKGQIKEGLYSFINDYGYLMNHTDKMRFLELIKNVNIFRNAKMNDITLGYYNASDDNIYIKYEDDLNTITHEFSHLITDNGKFVGTCVELGRALNEGITESINLKYYNVTSKKGSYPTERNDVFKLSLLCDRDAIIDSYLHSDLSIFIDNICDNCDRISKRDVLKYLYLMDTLLENNLSNKNSEELVLQKTQLYNKMFKAKYGYSFYDSYANKVYNNNFLDDEFVCSSSKGIFDSTTYKVSFDKLKEMTNIELDNNILDLHFDFHKAYYYFFLFGGQETIFDNNIHTVSQIYDYFDKYENSDEIKDNIRLFLESDGLNDDLLPKYLDTLLNTVGNDMIDVKYTSSLLKMINENYCVNTNKSSKEFFNKTLEEVLNKNNSLSRDKLDEIKYYYFNTDIRLSSYSVGSFDDFELADSYYEINKASNYMIFDGDEFNYLIFNLDKHQVIYDEFDKDEDSVYDIEFTKKYSFEKVDDPSDIEKFNRLFNSNYGNYFVCTISKNEDLSNVNVFSYNPYKVNNVVDLSKHNNTTTTIKH